MCHPRRNPYYSLAEGLDSRVVDAASDRRDVSCGEELFFVSGDSSRFTPSSPSLSLLIVVGISLLAAVGITRCTDLLDIFGAVIAKQECASSQGLPSKLLCHLSNKETVNA
ncbi:unnamed protein product [Urochloa humidicola]